MSAPVELAVVGGGIVGATLAALAAQQARIEPARIVLIEPAAPVAPAAQESIDLRVSAFAPAGIALLTQVGAWPLLDASRLGVCERMRIWPEHLPPDSPDALVFDAAELGESQLAVIAENRAVQAALLARCAALGVRVLPHRVTHLSFADDVARLEVNGETFDAQLVAGADGAESAVRAAAGISVHRRGYQQLAIVAVVRPSRPQPGVAFQRFVSTGPVALLPLPGGDCSIVWSAQEPRANELLALDDAAFAAELTRVTTEVLGNLQMVSRRAAFPLRRLAAQRYIAPNCVLLGDAAHVIHPLAGQGVNQGLLDAQALVAALVSRPRGEGIAALSALRRYERERRAGNALMGGMVDTLDRIFSRPTGLPARIAAAGMGLVNRNLIARRFFFRQAAAGRS
ncbi:MAG: FAD-dependent monooxygenase [Nevskiaceae bacterium]|jgi:ubiquinone biosynthesis UbiH/UbiF/VisC/COQ6 family hydroxylase|nr:FAD-dependent monooxygenase [Nevskiaceae bacterium]